MITKENIKDFIRTIVDNNRGGVMQSLFENKVIVEDSSKLKQVLYTMYFRNKQLFLNVMKGIEYKFDTNNYTTKSDFVALLVPTVKSNFKLTPEANAKEWYNEVLDTLAGTTSTTGTTTVVDNKPAAGSQTTTIVIVVVVIAAIVGLIWYLNK